MEIFLPSDTKRIQSKRTDVIVKMVGLSDVGTLLFDDYLRYPLVVCARCVPRPQRTLFKNEPHVVRE